MAAVAGLCALALIAGSPSPHSDPWQIYVLEASRRFGMPVPWIRGVIRAESGGRSCIDGRPVRSGKGAMGLMQLMPSTWRQLRYDLGLGMNPDNPRDNIIAGTAYLRQTFDLFGYPDLFAAYNAGPYRLAMVRENVGRLPTATRAYQAAILSGLRSQDVPGARSDPPIERLFLVTALPSARAKPPPSVTSLFF
jgi:soluble lytic murein transglycosylase-like protein